MLQSQSGMLEESRDNLKTLLPEYLIPTLVFWCNKEHAEKEMILSKKHSDKVTRL